MDKSTFTSRRRFLSLTGSLAAGIALSAIPPAVSSAGAKECNETGPGFNPVEELMREHGILRRTALIFDEAVSLINGTEATPSKVLTESAGLIRRYVEDYHERLEEDEIFPRLEKAGQLNDLIKVLREQHAVGRRLTDKISKLSGSEALKAVKAEEEPSAAVRQIYGGPPMFGDKGSSIKHDLSSIVQQFILMNRYHSAMEDTVVFPVYHAMVPPEEFYALGEKFKERGNELFGYGGFEQIVASVVVMEKKLGTHDLAKFTPQV